MWTTTRLVLRNDRLLRRVFILHRIGRGNGVRGQKKKLKAKDVFKFFKAARNVTTHHSVLAAPKQKGQYVRPFSRLVSEGVQSSARLRITTQEFLSVFSVAAKNWPSSKKGFQDAKPYLKILERRGSEEIFLEDVMEEGIRIVEEILGVNV